MKKIDNNKLFDILKNDFSNIEVPDLKDQIKAKYLFNKEPIKEPSYKPNKYRLKYLMNSLVASIAVFMVVLIIIISKHPTIPSTIDGEKNIITFEAFTAISLMSDTSTSPLNNTLADNEVNYIPLAFNDPNTEVDKLNRYIPLVEQVLTINKGINITVLEESDKSEYENQEVIEIYTALEQKIIYNFYYNVTFTDVDQGQQEFQLEGIMVNNQLEYRLEGIKKIQNKKTKISLIATLNDSTSVLVERTLVDNEEMYEYTISENGVNSKSKMKIKNVNDELEVEFEFEDDTSEQYSFKQVIKDGKKNISILARSGNISRGNLQVYIVDDEETGKKMYEYLNENNETFRKDRKDNGPGNIPIPIEPPGEPGSGNPGNGWPGTGWPGAGRRP